MNHIGMKKKDYPLISNKKWFSENGTVYNKADDSVRILMVSGGGTEINLPNELAEKIAEWMNEMNNNK